MAHFGPFLQRRPLLVTLLNYRLRSRSRRLCKKRFVNKNNRETFKEDVQINSEQHLKTQQGLVGVQGPNREHRMGPLCLRQNILQKTIFLHQNERAKNALASNNFYLKIFALF